LIEQGANIKTVRAERSDETTLRLRYITTAEHGTWFVIRANGKRPAENDAWGGKMEGSAKVAVSGAIYLCVDGKRFWKPSAVPAIVDQMKDRLELLLMTPDTGQETPAWETRKPTIALWKSQEPLLKQRIDEVMPIYERLAAEAKQALEKRP
jgi:hypothetical protein